MHAHFVFSDGSKSKEFCTVELGTEILTMARRTGKVTDFEHSLLDSQLRRCGILDEKRFLDWLEEELGEVIADTVQRALKEQKDLHEFLKDEIFPEFNGCIMN